MGSAVSAILERPTSGRRFEPGARAERDDRLGPLERLEALCDPGSLQLIRTEVLSHAMGDRARHGDGVLGGSGTVGGRPVFCYAQDPRYAGGSLGEPHADTIARVLELAERGRAPVVGFVSSLAAARMQEGMAAPSAGTGGSSAHRRAAGGKVPQIWIACSPGLSAGGGAYSPALTDWIVMTEESSMFLTGPGVVREALGEVVDAETLGGAKVHAKNGVSHFVARDDADAATLARDLLGYLPSNSGEAAPHVRRRPPSGADPESIVPAQQRRVYDVRDVIGTIVDGGELLEVSAGWARNLVTGFARLDGRTVGVVANQPALHRRRADVASSEKGARFSSAKARLVRHPAAGARRHPRGICRARARRPFTSSASAPARGSCARVRSAGDRAADHRAHLRKEFGGAFITKNSKDLGADYVFAWPQSEIGIMGAKPAVGVIHRRQLAAADDPEAERDRLAAHYADTASCVREVVRGARVCSIELITSAGDTRASRLGLQHPGAAAMTDIPQGDVLLTGATGFVGMELLARYLERGDRNIVTLVRSDCHEGAQARIDAVLENLFGDEARVYRPRVQAVAADMTAPGLGLTEAERTRLAERVTKIVHSAASVSFSLPLDEAREINTEGTRRMLELAELAKERGGLECYAHISTAFVSGNHPGAFAECDNDVGQTFHNSYEKSKFEAEQLDPALA